MPFSSANGSRTPSPWSSPSCGSSPARAWSRGSTTRRGC